MPTTKALVAELEEEAQILRDTWADHGFPSDIENAKAVGSALSIRNTLDLINSKGEQ